MSRLGQRRTAPRLWARKRVPGLGHISDTILTTKHQRKEAFYFSNGLNVSMAILQQSLPRTSNRAGLISFQYIAPFLDGNRQACY